MAKPVQQNEANYRGKLTIIMQNKPNFPRGQMGASSVMTKDYENVSAFSRQQNKANQTQFPQHLQPGGDTGASKSPGGT
jgi:hypothetical protein